MEKRLSLRQREEQVHGMPSGSAQTWELTEHRVGRIPTLTLEGKWQPRKTRGGTGVTWRFSLWGWGQDQVLLTLNWEVVPG